MSQPRDDFFRKELVEELRRVENLVRQESALGEKASSPHLRRSLLRHILLQDRGTISKRKAI
jgi:hypothetical protein